MTNTDYAEISGKAGAILRAAAKCGLEIHAHAGTDLPRAWTIKDPVFTNDAIYVYWTPTKVASGRTVIYRASRRTRSALVKLTQNEAHAWVSARRTRETASAAPYLSPEG